MTIRENEETQASLFLQSKSRFRFMLGVDHAKVIVVDEEITCQPSLVQSKISAFANQQSDLVMSVM
jgi:hypothetical protein